MRLRRSYLRVYLVLFSLAMFCPGLVGGEGQVLTANYGNDRTNANLDEAVLNTSNVNPNQFGLVGQYTVDGQVYAQPLVVSSGVVRSPRGHVLIATMHNSVYWFDADPTRSAAPLWQVNLGPSLPASLLHFHDINPEIGILGTPVIDPASNTAYLVAESYENGAGVYKLHALDLSMGAEKFGGPVVIQATVGGTGDASVGGTIALDPMQHLQRPGLLLANHSIYIAFGSVFDRAPYHGWILAYDQTTLQQVAVFNSTPEGANGGVWQSGRGIATDDAGNILATPANGDYDGVANFGESLVKLSPNLQVLDWFAPADWRAMSDEDADLGSLGPIFVRGQNLVVTGDKLSNLYVIPADNMGHLGTDGSPVPQIFQPIVAGGLYNLALWNRDPAPIAYLVEPGDWTGAFQIAGGRMAETPFTQTPVTSDYPFEGIAISAKGSEAGTGILWMTGGDHSMANIPGTLYAFDALDLTNLLWSSDMNPGRDAMGGFAKFATPTIANGRVYVPTFSNTISVYGLLPAEKEAAQVLIHGSPEYATRKVSLRAACAGETACAPFRRHGITGIQPGIQPARLQPQSARSPE
ncbi:MAG TPA: hypothetical protein VKU01_31230 [Bryobacteraceae bacterium]|nr:hypothetical protein [Bryobacteraceae bacterium]